MPRRTRPLPERASPFSRRFLPLSSGEPVGRHNGLWHVGHACFATAPRAPACRLSLCRPRPRAPTGVPWRVVHHWALAQNVPGGPPRSAGLIAYKPSALHVATQLSQRVRRDRLALRCAQTVKAPGGPFQLGIEAADAQPNQRRLHSVDDPTLLSDEALALAVGALGILVL